MHNDAYISNARCGPIHPVPRNTFHHPEFGVGIRDTRPRGEVRRPRDRIRIQVVCRQPITAHHPNSTIPHNRIKHACDGDASGGDLRPCHSVLGCRHFRPRHCVISDSRPYGAVPECVITNSPAECGCRDTESACAPRSASIRRHCRACACARTGAEYDGRVLKIRRSHSCGPSNAANGDTRACACGCHKVPRRRHASHIRCAICRHCNPVEIRRRIYTKPTTASFIGIRQCASSANTGAQSGSIPDTIQISHRGRSACIDFKQPRLCIGHRRPSITAIGRK